MKSVLALMILVCLIASVVGWTTRGIEGVPDSQFWMRTSGIILLPAIALLVWAEFRRDAAPDFLKAYVKRYFERDGFCFVVLPSIQEGRFFWQVMFQNRYERPCKALVAFRPATRFVGFGRADLAEVRVEIDCDAGGFGCATVPYGIPPTYQGKRQRFELIAISQFPDGRGRMLRFRDGMPVGKHHRSGADVAVTVLSTLALHPHYFTHPAIFKLRLPEKVAAEAVGDVHQQVVWRLGDPVS